jgi:hypothetical protein
MKKVILYLILPALLYADPAFGQNLVPNGDFETYNLCPSAQSQTNRAIPWFDPGANLGGGSDYYNICAPYLSAVSVPTSGNGYQFPHSGNGYCGMYLYFGGIVNSREYISVQLTSPLVAGQCYYFNMYVNLANMSKFTTDAIHVYFTSTAITSTPSPGIINVTPQLINAPGNMPDSSSWIPVSGTYTAAGGEQYIIIGNFHPDNSTTLVQLYPFPASDNSYLLVDDVTLTVCTDIVQVNYNSTISLSPDYLSGTLRLIIKKPGKYRVQLYDVSGRILYNAETKENLSIPADHFVGGIIFYSISDVGSTITNGKILWR